MGTAQRDRREPDGFALDVPYRHLRLFLHRNALEKLRAGVLQSGAGSPGEIEAVLLGRHNPGDNGCPTLEIVEAEILEWGRELRAVPALKRERRLLQSAAVPGGELRCVGFARSRGEGAPGVDPVHAGLARDTLVGPDYVLMVLWAADLDSVAGAVFVHPPDGSSPGPGRPIRFESGPAGTKALPAVVEMEADRLGARRVQLDRAAPAPAPPAPVARPTRGVLRHWPAMLLALAALVAAVRIYQMQRPAVVSVAHEVDALAVDRDGAEIRLEWNRNAPLFSGADGAVLVIRDGAQTKTVGLDLGIERGLVLYTMATDEADFQIQVFGRRERTESVHVIRSGNIRDGAPGAASEPIVAASHPEPVKLAAAPTSPKGLEGETGQPRVEKKFQPASPARVAVIPTALPQAPEVVSGRPSIPVPVDLRPQPLPAPPPPAAEPAPAKPVHSRIVEAAQAVRRVAPKIPPEMRWWASHATVGVTAQVDTSGRVVSARVTESDKQGKVFEGLVLNAARQWQFEPARIDGKPVPSEVPIQFNFRPEGATVR